MFGKSEKYKLILEILFFKVIGYIWDIIKDYDNYILKNELNNWEK